MFLKSCRVFRVEIGFEPQFSPRKIISQKSLFWTTDLIRASRANRSQLIFHEFFPKIQIHDFSPRFRLLIDHEVCSLKMFEFHDYFESKVNSRKGYLISTNLPHCPFRHVGRSRPIAGEQFDLSLVVIARNQRT